MKIADLAPEDRPRERLLRLGARHLTDAELLAILVGSGSPGMTAVELMQQVLDFYGGSLGRLGRATLEELTGNVVDVDAQTGRRVAHKRFLGMGEAKAITLLAACELGRRRQMEGRELRPIIRSSADIRDYFMREEVHTQAVEGFWLLCINNMGRVIRHERLSTGGLTSTMVDVRQLLRIALLSEATRVAVCHNHPSGSLRPSREDDAMTQRVQQACQSVDLRLLDHVIITPEGCCYSYADEGRL